MKSKFFIIISLLTLCLISACSDMYDQQSPYDSVNVYSEKVSSPSIQLGMERVILSWTLPSDNVAKKILIEYSSYGQQKKSIVSDQMIDTYVLTGLNSGFVYDFSIYTLDANENRSLPIHIVGRPFSKGSVAALEEVLVSGYTKTDQGYALKWDFPQGMRYDNTLNYRVSGADGFRVEGTQAGGQDQRVDGEIKTHISAPIPTLVEGNIYTLYTQVQAIPFDGDSFSVDAVTLYDTVVFELVAPKLHVSFNSGHGASAIPSILVSYGDFITPPTVPTHPTKTFTGWRVINEALFGRYFDFDATSVTEDLILHAVWVPKTIPNAELPEMVEVKGGVFIMGDSWSESPNANETPLHQVTLNSFLMSKFEVTQQLFSYVLNGYNPAYNLTQAQGAHASGVPVEPLHPASGVTYNEAVTFCNYLSVLSGLEPCYTLHANTISSTTDPIEWWFISTSKTAWQITCDITKNGYRLPTEAEWEYAAAGGGNMIVRNMYSGTNTNDELADYAWCASVAEGVTHRVGTKRPNNLGLYDMSGNVMEWCTDLYSYGSVVNYYTEESQSNPCADPQVKDVPEATKRVCRGGSFRWDNDSFCRVAWRDGNAPGYKSADAGLRLVRTKR